VYWSYRILRISTALRSTRCNNNPTHRINPTILLTLITLLTLLTLLTLPILHISFKLPYSLSLVPLHAQVSSTQSHLKPVQPENTQPTLPSLPSLPSGVFYGQPSPSPFNPWRITALEQRHHHHPAGHSPYHRGEGSDCGRCRRWIRRFCRGERSSGRPRLGYVDGVGGNDTFGTGL
jgi:hypothetical protein